MKSFFGARGPRGASADPFGFESMFGGGAGGPANFQPENIPPFGKEQGEDVATRISISFLDAIRGAKRIFSFTGVNRCGTCNGSGLKASSGPRKCTQCGGSGEQVISQGGFRLRTTCSSCGGNGITVKKDDYCRTCDGHGQVREHKEVSINIPAGVDSGERLRVSGKGNVGTRGYAGDLFITLDVQKPGPSEAMFSRHGSDLTVEVPIFVILRVTIKIPINF